MNLLVSRYPSLVVRLGIAATLALAALAAPAANAQIVTNGSFELGSFTGTNPQNAAHATQLVTGATNITGWTVLNGGNVSDIAWLENANPYGISASDGIRSLDLTGYRDSAPYGGVVQTLNLTAGSTYALRFDIGSNGGNASYGGAIAVRALVGNLDQTFTFTPTIGSTGQQYGTFTANFFAASAVTPLQLSGVSTAGGQYIGLDNVVVTLVSSGSSAPEPGTVALLSSALLPAFALLRCRRTSAG